MNRGQKEIILMNNRIKKKLHKRYGCFHYKPYKDIRKLYGDDIYDMIEMKVTNELKQLLLNLKNELFGGKS